MSNASTGADDFRALVFTVWRARILVLAATALGFAGSVAFVLLATPTYRAQVVLMPSENDSIEGGLRGAVGELGGLASLAGVKLGSDSQTPEAIALLKSRQFTSEFVEQNRLLPVLFHKKWDEQRKVWRVKGKAVPTYGDAFRLFDDKIRRVTQDKRDGVVTLTILWRDRVAAARWANELVTRVNEVMRARVISESQASLDQLQKQLAATELVPLQQSLAKLVEAEIKRRTVATVRKDYVFRVIDPAVPSDEDDVYSPKKALTVLAGTILGLIIGGLAALVRANLRVGSQQPPLAS